MNEFSGYAHPIPRCCCLTGDLVASARDRLFHCGSCFVGWQSAVSGSQTRSPGFPKTIPVPVRSLREPGHRLFGRSNGYPKAVILKDYGRFPTCDEHGPILGGELLMHTYSAGAVIVPQIFRNAGAEA
jgi:hypothetical protein